MSRSYGTVEERDERESVATIHRALDLGVTPFDTAEACGRHANEELLGRAMKGRRGGASDRGVGRCFSRQTFEATCWLKRPALLPEVFHALTHCTGFRQLARKLACSPRTVYHQTLRLGRPRRPARAHRRAPHRLLPRRPHQPRPALRHQPPRPPRPPLLRQPRARDQRRLQEHPRRHTLRYAA